HRSSTAELLLATSNSSMTPRSMSNSLSLTASSALPKMLPGLMMSSSGITPPGKPHALPPLSRKMGDGDRHGTGDIFSSGEDMSTHQDNIGRGGHQDLQLAQSKKSTAQYKNDVQDDADHLAGAAPSSAGSVAGTMSVKNVAHQKKDKMPAGGLPSSAGTSRTGPAPGGGEFLLPASSSSSKESVKSNVSSSGGNVEQEKDYMRRGGGGAPPGLAGAAPVHLTTSTAKKVPKLQLSLGSATGTGVAG
ncbi:unnamed protein product, partial [Amoebophrya sp. A120]